jgi:acetylornithine/N-succinyldiaminopimelate aminotransferase
VTQIRGEGLMLGLKCLVPNGEVIAALAEGHVLAIPAGDNVVRRLPPLIVSVAEFKQGVEMIDAALDALEKRLVSAAE